MEINYTLPVWTVVVAIITIAIPIIWSLIKMYFNYTNLKDQIKNMQVHIEFQEKSIATIKKDIEDKLDRHKTSNDQRLMEINNTMIATKTLVELLVADKIK